MFSLNAISAEDNSTLLAASIDSPDVLQAPNGINVHVSDSYVAENNTWTEDGVNLANASVSVYDSSNNLVFSGLTDSEGNVVISNLNSANYNVEIKYSTYECWYGYCYRAQNGNCHGKTGWYWYYPQEYVY